MRDLSGVFFGRLTKRGIIVSDPKFRLVGSLYMNKVWATSGEEERVANAYRSWSTRRRLQK